MLRSIIGVMTGSIEDSTFGLSSQRSSNALMQMQQSYNLANQRQRNNSSMRSRKSSPLTDRPLAEISDDVRE